MNAIARPKTSAQTYERTNFRRSIPAIPINPEPNNIRLEGSGVVAVPMNSCGPEDVSFEGM
jgi:hypothetical protein